jgi:hypothetical protein
MINQKVALTNHEVNHVVEGAVNRNLETETSLPSLEDQVGVNTLFTFRVGKNGATLKHSTHAPIYLLEGIYHANNQQEQNPGKDMEDAMRSFD